ncbi:UDP-2,3-diacylglucosamine diphosphatase [Legionella sp. D16C41]|uniref:UDP-2,3-diacylglucosamine diphosphatase n=1 Tax=Legionella sp. D16C41 TaxID=3402688 RepID=UPI003AF992E5
MLDAVFISDLHLHPDEDVINERFAKFIDWAATNTRTLYILGDFFHAWAGDDTMDSWSLSVANALKALVHQGVTVFFMPGNRDFLVGSHFLKLAGLKLLKEPTIIHLAGKPALLVHGDRYCIHDKSHQRFRKLTRNTLFMTLFLQLPKVIRKKLVNKVRQHSQNNYTKPPNSMVVEPKALLAHMQQCQVKTLIHGHTHQPGLTTHLFQHQKHEQYVLSDWDDNPQILCYHISKGLYFSQIYL